MACLPKPLWMLFALPYLLPLAAAGAAPAPDPAGASVKIEFQAQAHDAQVKRLQAGQDLRLGFQVADSQSGFGISSLHPMAWLTPREAGQPKPDQQACETQIKRLLRGGVSNPAAAELNGFYILALNADNTVAILNPLVNLNTSNLLALIPLEGQAAAWTLDSRRGLVYVTLPKAGKLAVVDINARAVRKYLPAIKGAEQVALQSDGRYLWIGGSGGQVQVFDAVTQTALKRFSLGRGRTQLAFDDKGRYAFIASDAGQVAIIDIATLRERSRVTLAPGALRLAYSPLSEALYVAGGQSGRIAVLYPQARHSRDRIAVDTGISTLAASPDGRYLFALHPKRRQVTIIDTASQRVLRTLPTGNKPDHIVFSKDYAYIRNTGATQVTLIGLPALADLKTTPVIAIPTGVDRPDQAPLRPGLSPIALLPEGGGALIVNPADKVIYFYMEGMMVPQNSLKSYAATPLGLLAFDRSLKEGLVPGLYESNVRLSEGGVYDVAFFLSNPRTATCFELTVEGPRKQQTAQARPILHSRFADTPFRPGEPAKLRFELLDGSSGKPLSDAGEVHVLSFLQSGYWQARSTARALGDGLYEADFTFPKAGKYHVLLEAPARGLRFGDIRPVYATVLAQESKP